MMKNKNLILAALLLLPSIGFSQSVVKAKQVDTLLERKSNKATSMSSPNNTTYPTTQALQNYFTSQATLQNVIVNGNTTSNPFTKTNSGTFSNSIQVVNLPAERKFTFGSNFIGQMVIKHANITPGVMVDMDIAISQYSLTNGKPATIRVQFYRSTAGGDNFQGMGATVAGNDFAIYTDIADLGGIRLGYDPSGNISIILGKQTTNWGQHPAVVVRSITVYHDAGGNSGWRSGWSIDTTSADISSTYTGLVDVGNVARFASRDWVQSNNYLTAETDPIYTAAEPTILRYRSTITSSANLNSFTSTGIYNGSSAVTATLSNCPFPSGEIQLSVTTSGNYIRQMITNVGSTFTNQIYTRTSVNGGTSWSSWQRLILGGDSVSLLTNDAGYITQNIANANLPIAGGTNRTLTIGAGSTFSIVGNSMIRMSGGGGNPALELIAPYVFISGDNPDSFGVSMRTINLTTNRDVDWQDTSGTVAFLHDIHPTGLVFTSENYTVQPTDLTIICGGSTTFLITLPDPAANPNRTLIIAMQMGIESGAEVELSEDIKHLDRSDGENVLSASRLPATAYGKAFRLQSDGSVWWFINPDN